MPLVARPYDRVHRHVQTLGVLWIVYAGWTALQWLLAATFLAGIFGGMRHGLGPFGEGFPFMNIPWFVPFITVIVVVRSILAIATGAALLRRAPWARGLALVTAFLTLIKPITGTVLAIYTLWVLLPESSGAEYEELHAG